MLEAVFFDLDDTLFDTFHTLIVPLEHENARAMAAAGFEGDPTELAQAMLQLRKEQPRALEPTLLARFPGLSEAHVDLRRERLHRVALEGIQLDPRVAALLERVHARWPLALVTSGRQEFQSEKLARLGIHRLFREIEIVGPGGKPDAFRRILERQAWDPSGVVVVGNRLDDELQAAASLGMITVWVTAGEGSEMSATDAGGLQPDHTVARVTEVSDLLDALERR